MNKLTPKHKIRFTAITFISAIPILAILFTLQILSSPVQAKSYASSVLGCPTWPTTASNEAILSDAIVCFNGETTPASYVLSITADIDLNSSLPEIDNTTPGVRLDIRGLGKIVDGQGILGVRPFAIAPATTVSMQGIRVAGGWVMTSGGGILNRGTLSITNSIIRNNSAGNGGGLYNDSGTLSIRDSLIAGNYTDGGGGGIYNYEGVLTVRDSTVNGNTAEGDGGGGILFDGSLPGAKTTVSHSTISNNISDGDYGGGIYASDDGDTDGRILIEYTTVYSNVSLSDEGSGIVNYGPIMTITHSAVISNVNYEDGDAGVGAWAPTTILNTTISGNRAMTNGVGGAGIGVYEAVVTLTNVTIVNNWMAPGPSGSGGISDWEQNGGELLIINNSIIANNTGGANPDCTFGQDGDDGRVDFNNAPNILGDPTGCNSLNGGSVQNVDPLVTALGNNGGETPTHALLPNSPAINQIAAGTFGCGTTVITDQRGVVRPQGPACDIGSYEVSPFRLYMPAVYKPD